MFFVKSACLHTLPQTQEGDRLARSKSRTQSRAKLAAALLAALVGVPAQAADWSTANVQYLAGDGYKLGTVCAPIWWAWAYRSSCPVLHLLT